MFSSIQSKPPYFMCHLAVHKFRCALVLRTVDQAVHCRKPVAEELSLPPPPSCDVTITRFLLSTTTCAKLEMIDVKLSIYPKHFTADTHSFYSARGQKNTFQENGHSYGSKFFMSGPPLLLICLLHPLAECAVVQTADHL